MHSSKGLEFARLAVVAVNADNLPNPAATTPASEVSHFGILETYDLGIQAASLRRYLRFVRDEDRGADCRLARRFYQEGALRNVRTAARGRGDQ